MPSGMLRQIRQIRALQARRISTEGSPYEKYTKLRAFPFHISPKKAQRLLSPWAAFISGNMKKVWPSAATIIPFLDLGYLRPARFHAVYFPAWFVTADVEASVTYKGTQCLVRQYVREPYLRTAPPHLEISPSYIPGSHAAVLSAAPLKSHSLMDKLEETVPFSTSLLHQHGKSVLCVPFSTSPFSILDIAASHPPSRSITISEDLSIDISSVKPNLISAYPVLLPLYIAQYEIEKGKDSTDNMLNFIFKAYGNLGLDTIMCANLIKVDEKIRKAIETLIKSTGHKSSGEVMTFLPECPRVSMPDVFMPHQRTIINELLEGLLCSYRNIEVLAESSLGVIGKGDDDLRIRKMTSEERESLENYTHDAEFGMLEKWRLSKLIEIERRFIEDSLPIPRNISKEKKFVEEWVKGYEARRAKLVPKWWSEWLALNRPVENTESGDEMKEIKNVAGGTPSCPPVKDLDKVD